MIDKAVCPYCKQEIDAPTAMLKMFVEVFGCAACKVKRDQKADSSMGVLMPI